VRRHNYTYVIAGKSETFANIEATIPGAEGNKQILVIGAHYDSVPGSPGANDNGTGVAAVLALAELLKDCRPQKTIRLVAFPNEESPYFAGPAMGSLNYASECKEQNLDVVMFSLETMGYYSDEPGSQSYPPGVSGYPDCGNFIGLVANLESKQLLDQTVAYFAQSNFPFAAIAAPPATPGVSLSDHMCFWEQGYNAVMVTDTAPFRYPHYHTAEDTPDKINLPMFTNLVASLAKTFALLAGSAAEGL
jgi:Zn-dependent M28 family amino/carboxypeptidase